MGTSVSPWFQGAEPGPPFFPGDHLITTSGKMVLLAGAYTRPLYSST